MAMDQLRDETRKDLEALAAQHSTFESFLQEVQRYADLAWHNVRGRQPTSMQPHEHIKGTQATAFDSVTVGQGAKLTYDDGTEPTGGLSASISRSRRKSVRDAKLPDPKEGDG